MKPIVARCVLSSSLCCACTSAADPESEGRRRGLAIDPDAGVQRVVAAPVAAEQAQPAGDVDAITCQFFWRPSVSEGFAPRDQLAVRLAAPGDERTFERGDFRVRVGLDDSAAGGGRLVLAFDAGAMSVDDVYDFGAQPFPANLPAGGHGFTGLHYLEHPRSGSELQYSCGAGETAGPPAATPAVIRCEWIAEALEGSNGFFSLDPRKAHGTKPVSDGAELTPYRVGASYLPGGMESGGVTVDLAAGKRGGVHVLYQLHGSDVPANLFAEQGGFTGTTTVRLDKVDTRVSHRCAVEAPAATP